MTVVCFQTKHGLFKAELDAKTATCAQLYALCAERLSVNASQLAIFRNGQRVDSASAELLRSAVDLSSPAMFTVEGADEAAVELHEKPSVVRDGNALLTSAATLQDCKYLPFELFLDQRNYSVADLPLAKPLLRYKVAKGSETRVPPPVTLAAQPYRHVDQIEVLRAEALNFHLTRWQLAGCKKPEFAFLLGYYLPAKAYGDGRIAGIKAVVENLCAPAQCFDEESGEIVINDSDVAVLEAVLQRLDMHIVGVLLAHGRHDSNLPVEHFLSLSKLQLQLLAYDLHYTGYPVPNLVILTAKPADADVRFDAFMVSDLGLLLVAEERLAYSDGKLVVAPSPSDVVLPAVLENGKSVNEVDPDWFTVRVNETVSANPQARFRKQSFATRDHSLACLKKFMEHVKSYESAELSDLNLIVFIAKILGLESIAPLIDFVNAGTEIEPSYFEMLRAVCDSAAS